jgi:hypothetical protein
MNIRPAYLLLVAVTLATAVQAEGHAPAALGKFPVDIVASHFTPYQSYDAADDRGRYRITYQASPGLSFCVNYAAIHGAETFAEGRCLVAGPDGHVQDKVEATLYSNSNAALVATVTLVDNRAYAQTLSR